MSAKKEVDDCQSEEASSQAESFDASKSGTSETYDMKDFCPGIRIEAKDFDGKWYPAKVSDVDWTENEILVHFENWNTKFDEWIPMDSSRLRPIQKAAVQQKEIVKFSKGEEVMAVWSANQKYPGIIQAVLANDRYDVLFSDGFLKRLKGHKISKLQEGSLKPEIKTFSDIGTKEERRERKRKINVAELFHINKRSKKKGLVSSKPQDIKTYPVSKSRTKGSVIKKLESSEKDSEEVLSTETKEEKRKDNKVCIPVAHVVNKALVDNIPAAFEVKYLNGQTETWSKQLYQRSEGRTAGKLDIVILNPQGRKFRSRNEIMKYCEENGIVYSHEAFDFSAKGRPKSKPVMQTSTLKSEPNVDDKEKTIKKGGRKTQNDTLTGVPNYGGVSLQSEISSQENVTPNKVFIGEYEVVIENGKFICPVKVCAKHFRRENLLHMHMKHYHPEFSKYLDYTPSVTDLAYARTVGNLDAVETPQSAPRKVSGSDKLDKSSVKAETFRRTNEVSSESTKETKKLKTGDSKIESKANAVKLSSDVFSASVPSGEEPCEENSKNKVSPASLHSGKNSNNLNETDKELQENSENILNESTNDHTPQDRDSLSVTSGVVKPSKQPRLHSRKKSNRFQGSFSEHLRKRRLLSQDRSKPHNRLVRQPQSQLPGHLPPTQHLQNTSSPQSFVEDTNSNTPSQGPTMSRYLKPNLNISNEMSGKNILLTNYKTSSPVSEVKEKGTLTRERNETISVTENSIKSTINIPSARKRNLLTVLLNARKRKSFRKRRRKNRNEMKRSVKSRELDLTFQENESGRDKIKEKPDTPDESRNFKNENNVVNMLKFDKTSQIPLIKKSLKVLIRRLSTDSQNIDEVVSDDFSNLSPDVSAPFKKTDDTAFVNVIKQDLNTERKKSSNPISKTVLNSSENIENSPPERKIKSEIYFKNLPKPYVLLENILKKKNLLECETLDEEKSKKIVPPKNFQRRGKKRKQKKSNHGINHKRKPAKKVRFENSMLENYTDEGKALDRSERYPKREEPITKELQKNSERKFHVNKYLSENVVKQQKQLDDSLRNYKCVVNKKMHSLDQVEATEDSKSPVTVENDKVEKLRRNEIINCLCGITEEDGLMIQCDICLCWQHGHCAGILKELDVPDKYTCAICKNPYRGRSSMKYLHDQEWLKEGTLPSLSFRSKRSDTIEQRKAILKRSHDLSGSITLLAEVIHSLRIKVNIAEKKDHPKLWLWAKKWTEKKPNRLKEEFEIKEERSEDRNLDSTNEVKKEESSSDKKCLPKAPEPEAPIDSAECRLNLLDHLIHYQSLIDARLSCIESLVAELESMQDDAVNDETPDRYPRTKATVQMILRDLNTMTKIASI